MTGVRAGRARRVRRAATPMGLAAALLLAGCSAAGAQPAATQTAAATGGPTLSVTVADGQLVDRHPDGAVLAIKGVQVRPNSIALDVSLVNGYVEEVRLVDNALFRGRDSYLVDDLGNPYRYDHRGSNPDLRVAPGQELSGSVVFLGRVPTEATTFALKTNVGNPADAVDVSNRDRNTQLPNFFIDGIPIP